jgi:hypothetical protein
MPQELMLRGGIVPGAGQHPFFQYSVGLLLRTAVWARQHPEGVIEPQGLFPPRMLTGQAWRQWFRGCLMAKIHRHESPRGRKESLDWWQEMVRAARALNTPR